MTGEQGSCSESLSCPVCWFDVPNPLVTQCNTPDTAAETARFSSECIPSLSYANINPDPKRLETVKHIFEARVRFKNHGQSFGQRTLVERTRKLAPVKPFVGSFRDTRSLLAVITRMR